jgi:hypothetical protein
VIPTHVHLDHAGGAGLLMRELPSATLVVHPRGARHMIAPEVLYQSALAVYGQAEMDRSYGRLVGIDAERVTTTHDGMVLALAGRPLQFADTPGHARHHHCVWDAATRGWFTGDTFGLSYREFDNVDGQPWIFPTSTPVQFDPRPCAPPSSGWCRSIRRASTSPTMAASTASGASRTCCCRSSTPWWPSRGRLRDVADRHEALKEGLLALYRDRLHAHGCRLPDERSDELLALDVQLNAQGIEVWLDRQASR